MDLKPIFKINRKTFFDPTSWVGYDLIKTQTQWFWQIAKGLFMAAPTAPNAPQESFAAAIKRYGLTEKDLKNQATKYIIVAMTLAMLAVGVWGFAIYLLLKGYFAGCILSLAIGIFFLGQAFRFHFWRFQIIHRKLGCTFEEWRNGKPLDTRGDP